MEIQYVIEYWDNDTQEWTINPHSDYLMGTHVGLITPGEEVMLARSGNIKAGHRKVPKDPLLKAIVLATLTSKQSPPKPNNLCPAAPTPDSIETIPDHPNSE